MLLQNTSVQKIDDKEYCNMSRDVNILEKIQSMAMEHANEIAIDAETTKLSYREYFDTALALATLLETHHIGAEDKVVVFLDQSEHIPVALLSILIAGAVYVPIDTAWPKIRIDAILDDVSPKAILTQSNFLDRFQHLKNVTVIEVDEIVFDCTTAAKIADPDSSSVAVIFYTSGSTGMPKGVELSYGNLQSFIESAFDTYGFKNSDVHLAIAKYSFSISIFDLLLPFYCGGSLKLRPRQQLLNSNTLAELIADSSCFHMGPALLESLIRYAEDDNLVFANILHVSSGGDMVPASLLERCKTRFPNAEIWVIYGCTEIACMGTTWQVDRATSTSVTYVGKTFKHSKVLLLDDSRCPVSTGEIGEVYFSGDGVTRGYLNRDELNETKFTSINGNRYYATGDYGIIDKNNNLQLKGRKDFQIKINGVRIETEEIEYWLNDIAGVEKSIVVGARDKRGDLKIVAFVKKRSNTDIPDENSIKQQLAIALPDYMVPNKIYPTKDFPLNTNGKLDRNALIGKAEHNLADNHSGITDTDEIANKLMEIWFNAGASGTIYEDSNFFDLGGDSLGAVQLVYTISADFKVDCDFEFIYAHPVFSAQLAAIKKGTIGNETVPDSIVVPLDDKALTSTKRLFMFPGLDGHVVSYHDFGKLLPDEWSAHGLLYPNFAEEEYDTIQDVARKLLTEILKVQKQGPYYLCGHSSGGIVSAEIARLLKTMGKQVYLVLVEVRLFEKAPRKRFKDVFIVYLKHKPRIYLDSLLTNNTKHYLTAPLDPNNRAKQKEALKLPKLKGAFTLSKKQLDGYELKVCDVPAVLIKGNESIWWDALRTWPEDYGLSEYFKLKTTLWCTGDHVSIAMDKNNHPNLAGSIKEALLLFEN
jgi:amino acid adenylation domain-containing protein